jgi:hypothetical protein
VRDVADPADISVLPLLGTLLAGQIGQEAHEALDPALKKAMASTDWTPCSLPRKRRTPVSSSPVASTSAALG